MTIPFLTIVAILVLAYLWHLLLEELDYRLHARKAMREASRERMWQEIARRIQEEQEK